MKNEPISFRLKNYRVLLTDFDGVLTDNTVIVSQEGTEFVRCSRSDGLAFNYLKNIDFPVFILSSETNSIVNARAKKLNVNCRQGLKNKVSEIRIIMKELSCNPNEIIYVGNDINDLGAMKFSGLTFCPSDSHHLVKEKASVVLTTAGGQGVLREIIEYWFNINLTLKYLEEI